MIENRRGLTIFSHVMLILGIAAILFPLYVAFVAATLDNRAVFETPMTLIPGSHLLDNMYLWPLLIVSDVNLGTAVAGIKGMIATGEGTTQWNQVMAAMLLTLIPPVVIVLAMQRAFVRGLVDSEK